MRMLSAVMVAMGALLLSSGASAQPAAPLLILKLAPGPMDETINKGEIKVTWPEAGMYWLETGTEDNKTVLETISGFINSFIKPSNTRQEQLLLDICTKLENLNENKNRTVDKTFPVNNKTVNINELTVMEQNKTENQTSDDLTMESEESELEIPRNDLYNPFWIDMKIFGQFFTFTKCSFTSFSWLL